VVPASAATTGEENEPEAANVESQAEADALLFSSAVASPSQPAPDETATSTAAPSAVELDATSVDLASFQQTAGDGERVRWR